MLQHPVAMLLGSTAIVLGLCAALYFYLRATHARRCVDRILRNAERVSHGASRNGELTGWRQAARTCRPLMLFALPVVVMALGAGAWSAAALCTACVVGILVATRLEPVRASATARR